MNIAATLTIVIAAAFGIAAQGKAPIIFIPGLTGSELINSKTGQTVWFRTRRARPDDLRLPIGPDLTANRDSLVARDVLRSVKSALLPRIDVYGGLLEVLEREGYREARWEAPPPRGYQNTVYLFSYDWRRDNVENARLLIRKIETLKRRLGRPGLKFNVLGHSMGGLIARFAAMYGDSDLPSGPAAPTWAGARHFENVVLLGTPNGGSVLALRDLINGSDLVGVQVNLPFVQNLSKFDVFTIPSGFQLLPAPGTFSALDDELKPLKIDIYDPAVWTEYGWNVIDDKDFSKEFTDAERRSAKAYFAMVLSRGKRFHEALAAGSGGAAPIIFNVIGADCKDTLNVMILRRDEDGKLDAKFDADSFTSISGRKVSSDELKKVMYAPGDGVVTRVSLLTDLLTQPSNAGTNVFVCESHDRLQLNADVQSRILSIFSRRVISAR